MKTHHQILIVGGGNAGISVAAQLLRKRATLDIAIVEPSNKHYYQPAWTLVGGGVFDVQDTVRDEASVMPEGVRWIKEYAEAFLPEQNTVTLRNGTALTYDFLVVCPGIQLNWGAVKGLPETLGKNGVTSNYAFEHTTYTYSCLQQLKPGQRALFTSPGTPVKCGGAPQKIMYLAADFWRKKGILNEVSVELWTAGTVIFGIKKYAEELSKMVDFYGIQLNFKHDLIAIDGPNKKATFKVTAPDGSVSEATTGFDMIHVTPPQSAPDFVRISPLANAAGWVEVNKHTLQHVRYTNVFGIGDVTNTPNAKTGAAIRKQAPVLVQNLLAALSQQTLEGHYTGYGSCPLVVGYGKLILAEFDYDNTPTETFPFDQAKPSWLMYQLKAKVLPWLYWNKILKGTA
jgi:sulfide:quinone oxidoreductase